MKQPSTTSAGKVILIIIGALVLIIFVIAIRSAPTKANSSPASVYTPVPAVPLLVHYEVTGDGSGSASITAQTPTGTSQSTTDLPLTNKSGTEGLIFSGFSHGDFLYISAQNQDEYGSVTCRIKVGDTVVSENTANGAYQIATCEGQA